MAESEHVALLHMGVDAWNKWRKQNPDIRPDLSGLNLRDKKTLQSISRDFDLAKPCVRGVDFSDTDLTKAELGYIAFDNCYFRGADLSEALAWHCIFEQCSFGPTEKMINDKMRADGTLSKADDAKFNALACKLDRTVLFDTKFSETSLCYVDLTTVDVDEKTSLETAGVINTRISWQVLEHLKDKGGLTTGRLRQMKIVDDVMKLRQSFSGFWNKLHFVAMSIFLAPYIWFLAKQWVLADVGTRVPIKATDSPILVNLFRFIVSGGDTWREWQLELIPITLFILAFLYNLFRGVLVVKTLILEHRQAIQGYYPEFTLTGGWKAVYQGYKWLGIIALFVLVVHTLHFLFKRVPI